MTDERPRVTREEFEKITCNRCGDCCESFYLSDRVFEDQVWIDGEKTTRWLTEVIPIGPVEEIGEWRGRKYKCPRFIRDLETNEGICTQHKERSHICANFPYGKPVDGDWLPRCSWNVRVVDPSETEH